MLYFVYLLLIKVVFDCKIIEDFGKKFVYDKCFRNLLFELDNFEFNVLMFRVNF